MNATSVAESSASNQGNDCVPVPEVGIGVEPVEGLVALVVTVHSPSFVTVAVRRPGYIYAGAVLLEIYLLVWYPPAN